MSALRGREGVDVDPLNPDIFQARELPANSLLDLFVRAVEQDGSRPAQTLSQLFVHSTVRLLQDPDLSHDDLIEVIGKFPTIYSMACQNAKSRPDSQPASYFAQILYLEPLYGAALTENVPRLWANTFIDRRLAPAYTWAAGKIVAASQLALKPEDLGQFATPWRLLQEAATTGITRVDEVLEESRAHRFIEFMGLNDGSTSYDNSPLMVTPVGRAVRELVDLKLPQPTVDS